MIAFTDENQRRFETILSRYEIKRSALLPTLYLAQEQFGFISKEVMDYVAKLLEVAPVHVYEAVSFYVMFKKKDMGKYCVQVCQNITCTMMGAEKIAAAFQRELGIKWGEVTRDGNFSLVPVQCVGACDIAPAVQVNETDIGNLTESGVTELIKGLIEDGPKRLNQEVRP